MLLLIKSGFAEMAYMLYENVLNPVFLTSNPNPPNFGVPLQLAT